MGRSRVARISGTEFIARVLLLRRGAPSPLTSCHPSRSCSMSNGLRTLAIIAALAAPSIALAQTCPPGSIAKEGVCTTAPSSGSSAGSAAATPAPATTPQATAGTTTPPAATTSNAPGGASTSTPSATASTTTQPTAAGTTPPPAAASTTTAPTAAGTTTTPGSGSSTPPNEANKIC